MLLFQTSQFTILNIYGHGYRTMFLDPYLTFQREGFFVDYNSLLED